MAKSFVSALVGVALHEGYSESIDDPIRDYLPVLSSPTFDGVTIKHVLGSTWLVSSPCSPSRSPARTHKAPSTGAVATVA